MAASKNERCWIGFDLGGTKMMAAVFDDELNILGKKRKRTKGDGSRSTQERMVDAIASALDNAGRKIDDVAGIGVGCPGPLDLEKQIVLEAVNLGWHDVAIGDFLKKQFKCPVVIANDVDMGVYGEYCFGSGKDARSLLGIFPGTGIGGGFVYEGKILHGRKSSCMEIGHMQMIPHGQLCGCGQYGCLETIASRLAIAAEAAKAVYRGEAPHLAKRSGADVMNIRSGALADSIANGDKSIELIIRNAAHYLGIAVANVTTLLLPDVVVLGGGLVEAMPDLVVTAVEETTRRYVMPAFFEQFEIKPAKLGDDAGIMGAGAWAKASIAGLEESADN